MHHLPLNLRLVLLAMVALGAALMGTSLTPGGASAGTFAFTGITCMEVTQGALPRASLIMTRFDTGLVLTSQGYEGDTNGDTIADTNAGPPCSELDDNNSLTAGVEPDVINTKTRPSDSVVTVVTKGAGPEAGAECVAGNAVDDDSDDFVNDGCLAVGTAESGAQCANATDDDADGNNINDGCPTATDNLEWVGDCTFRADINSWVLARFKINVTGQATFPASTSLNVGLLKVWLSPSETVCTSPPPSPTLTLPVTSRVRTVGASSGAPDADPDNWDNDTTTDWNELGVLAGVRCDPFNPGDDGDPDYCGPNGDVGGIAELPEVASTPLDASGDSGMDAGLIAAIAAGATAVAFGAAWYARRRLGRDRAR